MRPASASRSAPVFLLLLTLALACDSAGGPFIISDGGNNGPAQLRLFHAVANAGNLQLLTAGQSKLGSVGFGSVTPYIAITTPTVEVTLQSGGNSVIDTIISVPDSGFLTIVADGDSAAILIRSLPDQEPAADSTLVKVRALNQSPSSGSFDVYVTSPLVAIDTVTPTFTGVGFRTATDYVSLASGSYQVRFTSSGTKTVVIDTGTLGLADGDVRTIVALDANGGGTPAQSVILEDAGT